MSPSLFAFFINDLAVELKSLQKGIAIDDYNVSILLYADDVVIISDNEEDMQAMLDHVNSWCSKWRLLVNNSKSKIIHFRKEISTRSVFEFHIGEHTIDYVDKYKYLGVVFNEFLDFSVVSETLSQAASRALGALNSKFKVLKNVGFESYTKLYNASCVI